jgi:hypothetical protein
MVSPAEEEAAREEQLRQERQRARVQAAKSAVKGQAEKMALEAAKKYLLRVISAACGVTVAGLVVTALIMNFQLFYGNIVKGGNSAIALSMLEVVFVIALDFLLLAILLLLFVLFWLMVCIAKHPIGIAWDIIWGDFTLNRCVE